MRDKWQASVVIHGNKYRGGTYETVEAAALAVHEIAAQHGYGSDYPPP
jgi:hypothetical protein